MNINFFKRKRVRFRSLEILEICKSLKPGEMVEIKGTYRKNVSRALGNLRRKNLISNTYFTFFQKHRVFIKNMEPGFDIQALKKLRSKLKEK